MKKIIGFTIVAFLCFALLNGCAKPDIEKIPRSDMPQKAVMVDDTLYYYTGQKVELLRCGVMDGKIVETVPVTELPTENNHSNFGTDYEYQYVDENHIDVVMEDGWIRFCNGSCEKAVADGAEQYNTIVQDHSQPLTEELYSQWASDFVPDYDPKDYDTTHYGGIPEDVNPGGPNIPAHTAECPYDKCITDEDGHCIRIDGCICGYPLEQDIKTFPGHIWIVE